MRTHTSFRMRVLTITYYVAMGALTIASFFTTYSGTRWLMAAYGGWTVVSAAGALALGIQLIVVFGGLISGLTLREATRVSKWTTAVAVLIGIVISMLGIALSAATSYVNYHETVNDEHLQSVVDTAIDDLDRDYMSKLSRSRAGRASIDLAVEQARTEWAMWDNERRLQDSVYSPNGYAKGPRYLVAHNEAERLADYLERMTGQRPAGISGLSRDAGQLGIGASPLREFDEQIIRLPERLDLLQKVAAIHKPRLRYQAAYVIYRQSLGELARALSRLPNPKTLRLPEVREEFRDKQFGDRVTLSIDGQQVTNVPVPPSRRFDAAELGSIDMTVPAAYELLRVSVTSFQEAAGRTRDVSARAGQEEMLTLGEHPWLVAMTRAMAPGVMEIVTGVPAIVTDFAVLLISIAYGLICLCFSEDDNPLAELNTARRTLEELQKWIDNFSAEGLHGSEV